MNVIFISGATLLSSVVCLECVPHYVMTTASMQRQEDGLDVICLCATAGTETTTLIHSLCFTPHHKHTVYVQVSYYFLFPVLPASAAPPLLSIHTVSTYSNKGFMYCHNMINAVFAKGNYCQQKGRAAHEVITTERWWSCSPALTLALIQTQSSAKQICKKVTGINCLLGTVKCVSMCPRATRTASQVIEPDEWHIHQMVCL